MAVVQVTLQTLLLNALQRRNSGWLVGINRRPAHPPDQPNRGRWCASEDGERRVLIRSRPKPTAKIADRYIAPDPLAQKSEGNEGAPYPYSHWTAGRPNPGPVAC